MAAAPPRDIGWAVAATARGLWGAVYGLAESTQRTRTCRQVSCQRALSSAE